MIFPKPTGQYNVGTTSFYLKDENRKEIHSEKAADKRELMLQVWYPAKGDLKAASTPYASEACAEMLHAEMNISLNQLENLTKIRTHAEQDAMPDNTRKYPIILFFPGFVCPRTNNTAQCEELASHGYIVVGVDPTYAVAHVRFPDGRIKKRKEINILEQNIDDIEQQVWIDDALFVLSQLEKLNSSKESFLHSMFDCEKVGIFGHSYGGSTAAQLCRVEKRCKAGVSLDGGLFGKNPTEHFEKPFMFLLAEEWPWKNKTENDLKQMNISPKQYENIKTKWLDYIPTLCNALGHDTYQIKIKGTQHDGFSDLVLIKDMPSLKNFDLTTGSIDGFHVTQIINDYLVNFFDKYLKGKPSELLDGKETPYAEVERRNRK